MVTAIDINQPALLEFLRSPANHADHPSVVRVIETHISWVFLTGRYAYKLKKPVHFSFLDFSTVAKRYQACQAELKLNRRMAPHAYLKVVPIYCSPRGTLTWTPHGSPCDWVLKMKQLPNHLCLQQRLEENRILPRDVNALAAFLADYYRTQPPLTLIPTVVRERLADRIRDDQSELCQFLPDQTHRIHLLHAAQLRFLTVHKKLFDSRVCDGRFVSGHGDLRPEHVYLTCPPTIIDCVEFAADLRQIDIVDELSFLAMECDRIGQPSVGTQILDRYAESSGDHAPQSLVAFYKAYRACVRAKIESIRADQGSPSTRQACWQRAEDYLSLAEGYQPRFTRGLALVVCGLMGSGKSTLANGLADALGGDLLQTDQVRRQEFGVPQTRLGYSEGIYSPSARSSVYAALLDKADELLSLGATVVLDGTFTNTQPRFAIQRIAEQRGADLLFVHVDAPREMALSRIRQRQDDTDSESDARVDLYDRQESEWATDFGGADMLHVDATQPATQQLCDVLNRLACLPAAAHFA